MASLSEMTPATMGEMLGREVGDAVVLVAKNLILGGSEETVAGILGVDVGDVKELMQGQDYKDCYLLMAAQYNADNIQADLSYDKIEGIALRKIANGLDREKDLDKLVRIATMANRAVRRQKVNHNDDILDPGRAAGRVSLTLTRRLVEKLQNGGVSREETQQISIRGGAATPSFEEISDMFEGKPRVESQMRLVNQDDTVLTPELIGKLLAGK